jgi:hypothetical protein
VLFHMVTVVIIEGIQGRRIIGCRRNLIVGVFYGRWMIVERGNQCRIPLLSRVSTVLLQASTIVVIWVEERLLAGGWSYSTLALKSLNNDFVTKL